MTAFVPAQVGVMLPSDINDLAAAGIADGEFAKRVGGAWEGVPFSPLVWYATVGTIPVTILQTNLPQGTTNINVSIPSGYKLVLLDHTLSNPSNTGMIATIYFTRNGVQYQLLGNATSNLPARSSLITGQTAVLHPGDQISCVCAPPGGVAFSAFGYLIPDTSNIKGFSVPLPPSMEAALYECPTGKSAILIGSTIPARPQLSILNNTGGTRFVSVYVVPQGMNNDSTTIFHSRSIAHTATSGTLYGPIALSAGGKITASHDSVVNGLIITGLMYEFDA